MKKNLLLTSAAIVSFFTLVMLNEWLIYVSAIAMALMVIMVLWRLRSRTMGITRWAKANPKKAQLFITVLQLIILAAGLIVGYDLKQLGHQFSDVTALVFGTLIVVGFLSIRFFPRRQVVALPVQLNKDRLVYTGILVATYAMTVIMGNRIDDKYPNSIMANMLRTVDERIFMQQSDGYEEYNAPAVNRVVNHEASVLSTFASLVEPKETSTEPSLSKRETKEQLKAQKKVEKNQKRLQKRIERMRKAVAAGTTAGTVLLIILLALTLCAGVCMIIGGIAGGGAGWVVLGAVVTGASIWGIVELSKKRKSEKEQSL